jgi:hypothetical protein
VRLIVGAKGLEKGRVELRWRSDGQVDEIVLDEASQKVQSIVKQALQA